MQNAVHKTASFFKLQFIGFRCRQLAFNITLYCFRLKQQFFMQSVDKAVRNQNCDYRHRKIVTVTEFEFLNSTPTHYQCKLNQHNIWLIYCTM